MTSSAYAQVGFNPPVQLPAGSQPQWISTGDFNGDGRTDIAAGAGGNVSVALGQADGSFVELNALTDPNGVHPQATRDVTGDGFADLIYSRFFEGTIAIAPGTDTGAFGAPVVLDPGLAAGVADLAVADIDGDHDWDLFVLGRDGAIVAFRNNGGGVLGPPIAVGVAASAFPSTTTGSTAATAIAAGDLNGDGLDDFVACGTNLTRGISLGDGAFAMTEDSAISRPASCGAILLADMNGDGHLDALIREADNTAGDLVYRQGQAGGHFLPPVASGELWRRGRAGASENG